MSVQGVMVPSGIPPIRDTVLDRATIARRVSELGREISADYQGREVVLVGILKGAYLFASDLARSVSVPCQLEFVSISRYRRSTGFKEVRLIKDVDLDLSDRHVILVEDIVDTGLTLRYLVDELSGRSPDQLRFAACSIVLTSVWPTFPCVTSVSTSVKSSSWATDSTSENSTGDSPS